MRNQNQPVAVEGYPFIALFGFLTLVLGLLGWTFLTLLGLALTLFTVYFFRNPERCVPDDESAVVAPADGKVIFVGPVTEERFLKGPATKVSIFMSVFNVHVNRMPCDGVVRDRFYHPGEFLNAALDKASLANEQAGLLIETDRGLQLVCVQIAGLIARRIVTYPEPGDRVARGRRIGLIRFGSRVDLYFPPECRVQVQLGDLTVAGETIVGYLP